MASKRVPAPKDVLTVRQLPKVGDEIWIKATVTKVVEPEGSHHGRVTYRSPGTTTPTTVDARYVLDPDAGDA